MNQFYMFFQYLWPWKDLKMGILLYNIFFTCELFWTFFIEEKKNLKAYKFRWICKKYILGKQSCCNTFDGLLNKVEVLWEGHIIFRNHHLKFDVYYIHTVKSKVEISSICVAFSECLNTATFESECLTFEETIGCI